MVLERERKRQGRDREDDGLMGAPREPAAKAEATRAAKEKRMAAVCKTRTGR